VFRLTSTLGTGVAGKLGQLYLNTQAQSVCGGFCFQVLLISA
jgi:hypothetical protein